MNTRKLDSCFQRSGMAALSDLKHPDHAALFGILEREQAEFSKKEDQFRSQDYKWPRQPLYDFSRVWEYPYAYHHLRSYKANFQEPSRPLVLDLGSGVTFFPFAVAKLGYRVACADIDPICGRDIGLASACVPHASGTVEFRLIEGSTLPFADAECDAVYCISVLEHIPEFERTLLEMARVLKPNGLCVITCDINLRMDDDLQLGCEEFARMLQIIDRLFVRDCEERTIHPADLLTTLNGPYPRTAKQGLIKVVMRYVRNRVVLPLFGRKSSRGGPPHVAVFSLVLRRCAQ
jgi:SAM-dependent methyltransferase